MIYFLILNYDRLVTMDMINFAMLDLDDVDMVNVPEIPKIVLGYEYFNDNNLPIIENNHILREYDGYLEGMLGSVDMEDLLVIIYSYEDADISFDDLLQKMKDFYIEKATDECLLKHLKALDNTMDEDVLTIIYDNSVYSSYSDNLNVNVVIEFITSSYGYSYLSNVYNESCLWIGN